MDRFGVWLVMGGLLAGGASARGGEPEAPARDELSGEVRYALSRFVEATRSGAWDEACAAWRALEERKQAPARLQVLAAETYVHAGRGERGRALLAPLLAARDPRADALYLGARLAKQAGEVEEAKALLLRAASAGQAVLHDVGRDPELAMLLRDAEFAIQILKATRATRFSLPARDPFARPRGPSTKKDEPPPLRPSLAGLRRALERARAAAEKGDLERLDAALSDLRIEIEAAESEAAGGAEAVYAEARAALEELGERAHSIRLQLFVGRGNHLLRTLAERAEGHALEEARAARAELLAWTERFRNEERAIYRLTAARFEARASAIWTELEVQAEIAALKLPIEGIVIPPPGDAAQPSAIVAGRIVGVGSVLSVLSVLSRDGGELLSVGDERGVGVVSIQAGSVTFSYRGFRFVRARLREGPKRAEGKRGEGR